MSFKTSTSNIRQVVEKEAEAMQVLSNTNNESVMTLAKLMQQFSQLLFGLTSARPTFQRLMEHVLQGFHWKTLLLYLDYVIVISAIFEQHLRPSNCEALKRKVKYLGHVVNQQGVATNPDKVESVSDRRVP